MGSDDSPDGTVRRGHSDRSASRVLSQHCFLSGVLPFIVGFLLVLSIFQFRSSSFRYGSSDPRRLLASGDSLQRACETCKCPPSASSAQADLASKLAGTLTSQTAAAVLDAANSTDPALQTVRVNEDSLESLFLFVGILSGRGYRHRRLAVREAWGNRAQVPGISAARFILSEDERTPQVQKEIEQNGDIAFLDHKTNYKSILYKTYFVLEYAVTNFDVRFILKTDDDAFINVVPLISQLKLLCETPGCKNERVYMGRMAQRSEVMLQPGHKWNNEVYLNHTGLTTYPNYMMGGGYILSGDVAMGLVNIHKTMSLKFTPIEDATVAFWLMPIDLRHINHPRFFTWAQPCCFKAPVRREGQRIITRFQLADEMEQELCSDDPWLVLHKIDSPTKMRFIGNRVAECSFEDSDKVAPSIAPYIKRPAETDEADRHASDPQNLAENIPDPKTAQPKIVQLQ
ncbi:hypothetical protein WJX74_000688 [Apatococcus lobatus]|uniref:Hexosyltransferase n=1 Tax=Apatococcus lobatus TaxID=904363 RepID=A0AAW1QXH0_9CHLO